MAHFGADRAGATGAEGRDTHETNERGTVILRLGTVDVYP